MKPIAVTTIGLLLLALPGGLLPAQAASSQTYLLVAGEQAPGGTGQTTQYRLTAAQGAGVVGQRATSNQYILLGGFVASFDAPTTGRPWLTGVRPLFATMRGAAALQLHGTELNLGLPPTIKIGGQSATIGTRSNAVITTTLPNQPVPGWQPVEVANSLGTSTLPEGIGILPMIDLPRAPTSGVPFALRYRGKSGDQIVWLIALQKSSFGFSLAGFGYALHLDLASLVVLPAYAVTSPDGVFLLGIPAVALTVPVFVQGFSVSSDPGYSPGSFTNVLRL